MKLLHLDDSAPDLELTKLRLQHLDPEVEVVSCESADEALELIRGEEFDCVLSDYKMPNTNGIEFLVTLRDSGWNGPFIFFSGHSDEELVVRAMRTGADDYFTKEHGSGHYEILLKTIRKFVEMHRHAQIHQQLEASRDWEASVNAAVAELSKALIESAPVEEIAHIVLQYAKKLTSSAFGFVGHTDPDSGHLVCPTFTPEGSGGKAYHEFKEFGGLWGWVLKNKKSLITNSARQDPRASGVPEGHLPIERFLAAPAFVQNDLLGIVAVANSLKDYTERDQALIERIAAMYALALQREQRALKQRESEEKFRTLFENMEQGIIYHDEDGVIISANPAAGKILNSEIDNLIGRGPWDCFSKLIRENGEPFDPNDLPARVALRENRIVKNQVIGVPDRAGDRRWILVHSTPQYRSGESEPFQVFSTFTDITESLIIGKELELSRDKLDAYARHLESVNSELESFSYSVSHDLKAPLRAISGFTSLLLSEHMEQLDVDGQGHLMHIHGAAIHMSQLIEDLLKLSHASKGELHRTRVDLSEQAQRICDLMRSEEPNRQVDLKIEEGIIVDADERLARIVLENLLGNAWKFTSKKPETVIEFGIIRQNGNSICYVRDNGVGFDTRNTEKVFAPFKRLHCASEFPGTGIGLATVKRIINRHGGAIWCDSVVGKGATFYFKLS